MSAYRFLLVCLLLNAPSVFAADWDWNVGLGWVWQDRAEGAFATHTGLDSGLLVDRIELSKTSGDDQKPLFTLDAAGFGSAEPSNHLRMRWTPTRDWTITAELDERKSIFEGALRADDWRVRRGQIGLDWRPGQFLQAGLKLRRVERDGSRHRPLFALGELYPIVDDLDDSFDELVLRFGTRNLPFQIDLEHSIRSQTRLNHRSPDGPLAFEPDPDVLDAITTSRRVDQDLPTTRLTASWANRRFEVATTIFVADGDVDATGVETTSFDIDGGRVGSVDFIDDLVGSASLDSRIIALRAGWQLSSDWSLAFTSDLRRSTTDSNLLGERLLRVTNPAGDVFDIATPLDESSAFEVEEKRSRLELRWDREDLRAWVGAHLSDREVSTASGQPSEGDGLVVGLGWKPGQHFRGWVEFASDDIERHVFRVDPENVDRLSFRLDSRLEGGLRFALSGQVTEADGGPASLDRNSTRTTLSFGYAAKNNASVGLDLGINDLDLDTNLELPDGSREVSTYDLQLVTIGLHGSMDVGKGHKLSCRLNHYQDNGNTWPVDGWNAQVGLALDLAGPVDIEATVERWSWNEARRDDQDFDTSRFGLVLIWRSQS